MATPRSEAAVHHWEDRHTFLRQEAAHDLAAGEDVRPCFLAYSGDQPLFVAVVRPFAKGAHLDALIELLALAAPLDADRLAVSLPGRAWSLRDPIPPVLGDAGDLRQRVLCIDEADGAAGHTRSRSHIIPFDLHATTVRWGEPVVSEELSGPVSAALALAVRRRRRLRTGVAAIRAQAERCVQLGHLLALSEPVHERLTRPGAAPRRRC